MDKQNSDAKESLKSRMIGIAPNWDEETVLLSAPGVEILNG